MSRTTELRSQIARVAQRAAFALLGVSVAGMTGCASDFPNYQNQETFATPRQAVKSLESAAIAGDTAALESIFGPEGRDVLSSGDPVADETQREVFVVALRQHWDLEDIGKNTRELVVGHEDWPFPIPLVRDRRGWWFDTAAGKDEILARRIGRNELTAIDAMRTYVIAQTDYAAESHDDNPAGVYAQRVKSEESKHNGLYWPTTDPDEPPSPLGEFAAAAAADGYSTDPNVGPRPFFGYIFKVLTKQGPDAPGGALDYVVDGLMTEGFALVAYPATYRNSGIMTFIVNHDGIVYEADLGEDTVAIASEMTEYNPDDRWRPVE